MDYSLLQFWCSRQRGKRRAWNSINCDTRDGGPAPTCGHCPCAGSSPTHRRSPAWACLCACGFWSQQEGRAHVDLWRVGTGVSGFAWGWAFWSLPELERRKDGRTSLKQYPPQGLLIPWPAADHVNPDLSDRAACPGAASPPACAGGGDARLPEFASPARKGPRTKVGTTGPHPGRRQRALQLVSGPHMDARATCAGRTRSGVWGPGACVSLGPPGASLSLLVKGQRSIYLGLLKHV